MISSELADVLDSGKRHISINANQWGPAQVLLELGHLVKIQDTEHRQAESLQRDKMIPSHTQDAGFSQLLNTGMNIKKRFLKEAGCFHLSLPPLVLCSPSLTGRAPSEQPQS